MLINTFGIDYIVDIAKDIKRKLRPDQWALISDYFDRYGIASEVWGQLCMPEVWTKPVEVEEPEEELDKG